MPDDQKNVENKKQLRLNCFQRYLDLPLMPGGLSLEQEEGEKDNMGKLNVKSQMNNVKVVILTQWVLEISKVKTQINNQYSSVSECSITIFMPLTPEYIQQDRKTYAPCELPEEEDEHIWAMRGPTVKEF